MYRHIPRSLANCLMQHSTQVNQVSGVIPAIAADGVKLETTPLVTKRPEFETYAMMKRRNENERTE